MKKFLFLPFIFLFAALSAVGQESGGVSFSEEETASAKTQNKSTLDLSVNTVFLKRFTSARTPGWNRGHWAGVTLHYNGLVRSLGSLSVPNDLNYLSLSAKSIGVALNPFDVTLVHGKRAGLITGLGVEFNNFRFDQNISLKRENNVTGPDFYYEENHIRLTKSKFFTAYVNVPLLFEVQIGRRQNFFVNAGLVGGINIGSRTKVRANSPPLLNGTQKQNGNLGLRNFHYGYMLNFGYDMFGLSVIYYQSPLFRANEGPHIRQINIGLSIYL